MKLTVCLLLALSSLCLTSAFAQTKNDIPDFGKVDKTELQSNECDFEKNAEALVLLDVLTVDCKIMTYAVFSEIEGHVRIKIFKNKGLEHANVKLSYYSGPEPDRMEITGAQTYNLDASGNIVITKLDKKSIVDKRINKKRSEKIFSFPEAKAGSVIEYTYKIYGSLGTGLNAWDFQTSIPVKLSRYTIRYPGDLTVLCQAHCTLPVDEKTSTEHTDNVRVFTMTDIPSLREEPFMTCEEDYTQRLDPQVIAYTSSDGIRHKFTHNWPEISDMFLDDEDFGKQLDKKIPGTEDLDNKLKSVKDSIQRMVLVYRYVRDNMSWNGHYNIWALDGVKSAWKDKKGSDGDINLILVNMLKAAGLEVFPILVSTHGNGTANPLMPDWRQFDKVMAFVVIGGKTYVLDASDKSAPPMIIPAEVNYSRGFVVEQSEKFKWGWQLIWDEHNEYKEMVQISAVIDDQGLMNGDVTVTSKDYSRADKIVGLKKGKDQFTEKYFAAKNPSVHLDSLQIKNEEVDTLPLIQKLSFNTKLSSSGNYKYYTTNLFTGLEENPFASEKRFSDVFYGTNQDYTIMESFIIPDGYAFDELPKNVRMIMPDTSIVFTRIIETHEDLMNMRITLQFKKPVFGLDEYEGLRIFYKKLFDMLNEQIVIKKS